MKQECNCNSCGSPVIVEIAEPFVDVNLVGCICTSCANRHTAETGGVVLALREEDRLSRFSLGSITITPGAIAALAEAVEHAGTYLTRHVRGDWGAFGDCDQIELTEDERRLGWEATEDDAKINKSNLQNHRDRIMSGYQTRCGTPLWIITRLERGGGTTVLLPEEY